MKIALLLALLGHILCGAADCLMTYAPNGRFSLADAREPDKMARLFDGMSLKRLALSIVLGAIALLMAAYGYAALGLWMRGSSLVAGTIMTMCGLAFILPITAHHVCCGAAEWFYVRLNRTPEALNAVKDFLQATSTAMILGYAALLVYAGILFVMVMCGRTGLPRWACIFNTLPVYLVLLPTKLPAKGNIAGAVMFAGMLFLL